MMIWECCSAMLTAMAVWMWLNRNASWEDLPIPRLLVRCLIWCQTALCGAHEDGAGIGCNEDGGRDCDVGQNKELVDGSPSRLPSIGADAFVATLRASVRGGASLVQAFEELHGAPFAVPELTRFRIDMAVRSRCRNRRHAERRERLGAELHAVCMLSLSLGCETSRCLDAVAASLKRQRLMDDLRSNAYAMPQATARLLMALPALTVALGEGMGAHPVRFLLGDGRGWACLGFAGCCYAVGLVWIRALLRQEGG